MERGPLNRRLDTKIGGSGDVYFLPPDAMIPLSFGSSGWLIVMVAVATRRDAKEKSRSNGSFENVFDHIPQ